MRIHDKASPANAVCPHMKVDRALLIVALLFLALTLFLSGLSFQTTDFTLKVQIMVYATYIFISGIAILILIETIHLAKKEISQHHDA
jgi:hypothetical protein